MGGTAMKPILMGMNNPLSARPEHALFPYPPGCTGHRIWKMLEARTGATRSQYLEAFERRNLLNSLAWKKHEARPAALAVWPQLLGRVVVLLGNDPRDAFGVPPLLVHPQEYGGVTWRQLPHPSGRCHWYNSPKNRDVAALLLQELYEASVASVGKVA